MENAELIGLSRQVTLRRQMAVVANNLANMNTNGFKAEHSLFEEYIDPKAAHNGFERTDRPLSYVIDDRTLTDLRPGAIVRTENPTDLALDENQFFTIQTPQGIRYTRNGAFEIDSEGRLVTSEGYAVLGNGNAPIQFEPGDTKIAVGRDGTIGTSQGARGALAIVEVGNEETLVRTENNLFEGGNFQAAERPGVMQGFIEKSNVKGVSEVARMIEIQRAYERLANQIKRQDEIRRDAIRKLGKLEA